MIRASYAMADLFFNTSCLANCTCPECDDYFYEQAMEEEARLWREQNKKITPEKPAPPAEVRACTDDLPDFKELARQRRERQAYSAQRRVRRKALRRA